MKGSGLGMREKGLSVRDRNGIGWRAKKTPFPSPGHPAAGCVRLSSHGTQAQHLLLHDPRCRSGGKHGITHRATKKESAEAGSRKTPGSCPPRQTGHGWGRARHIQFAVFPPKNVNKNRGQLRLGGRVEEGGVVLCRERLGSPHR